MRRLITLTALTLTAVFISLPAKAQAPSPPGRRLEERNVLEALASRKVDLDFTGVPLEEAIAHLSRAAGVDLVLDEKVRKSLEARKVTVALALKNLNALNVLDILLDHYGLSFRFRDGVLHITTGVEFPGPPRTERYDVRRLLLRPLYNPGAVFDLFRSIHAQENSWRETPAVRAATINDLPELIRERVAPETWEEEGHGIAAGDGFLRITHTEEVHGEIRRLLRNLERLSGPEVEFHARILCVPPEALRRVSPGQPLSPEESRRLEAAAAGIPQLFEPARIRVMNGERTHFASGETFSFVSGRVEGNAAHRRARDGVVIDLHPLYVGGKGVPTLMRLFFAKGAVPPAGLPRMAFLRCETTLEVPVGASVLVTGGDVALGEEGLPASRTRLAVLLRAEPGPWSQIEEPRVHASSDNGGLQTLLRERKISVRYFDRPLWDLLKDLGERLRVNFVIHPRVFEKYSDDWLRVETCIFDDLPVEKILTRLLDWKCLKFQVRFGVVHILAKEQEVEVMTVGAERRHFPLRDLLISSIRESGPALRGFSGGTFPKGPFDGDEESVKIFEPEPINGESLVNLVRENIDPESWDTPPNDLNFIQGWMVAWNRPEILKQVEELMATLRANTWSGVSVVGTFLDAPLGWFDSTGPKGAALSPAQCDEVENALESGSVKVRGRFLASGILGRRFHATGGRQVAYVRTWKSDLIWEADVVLDGWCFDARAVRGTREGEVGLVGSALLTRYLPPAKPRTGPGTLETMYFWTDLTLVRGGGAVLGSASGSSRGGPSGTLFLRVR